MFPNFFPQLISFRGEEEKKGERHAALLFQRTQKKQKRSKFLTPINLSHSLALQSERVCPSLGERALINGTTNFLIILLLSRLEVGIRSSSTKNRGQGDQIGRIFAHWATSFFGQFFEN
jgi:hypothetical protein